MEKDQWECWACLYQLLYRDLSERELVLRQSGSLSRTRVEHWQFPQFVSVRTCLLYLLLYDDAGAMRKVEPAKGKCLTA